MDASRVIERSNNEEESEAGDFVYHTRGGDAQILVDDNEDRVVKVVADGNEIHMLIHIKKLKRMMLLTIKKLLTTITI